MYYFPNLDDTTRLIMVTELERDFKNGLFYIPKSIKSDFVCAYKKLLKSTFEKGDVTSLRRNLIPKFFKDKDKNGKKIPSNINEMIAFSDFNRYYMRAILVRAIDENKSVIIYRAKQSLNERAESKKLIFIFRQFLRRKILYINIKGIYMGKFDLGVTLAERCAAYVRTGRKNLLATRPAGKINIEGLRYAPNAVGDTLKLSPKSKSTTTFFENVVEDYQSVPNPFKPGRFWSKRIIHGKSPSEQILEHSFADSRLAQPIILQKHCNDIQKKSSNLSSNYIKQYLYKDEFNQARVGDYLYLDIIEVQECYKGQGVASKLLDKMILYAKENFNGRFKLTASTPSGCKNIYPPALVYWKKGFRFVNEEENQIMQKVLKGELPFSSVPEHTSMFLDKSLL